MKESFVFHKDWYDAIKVLDDKTRLEIYDAIMGKIYEDKQLDLSPLATMAMGFISPHLERDIRKYDEICEKRRESARLRWQNANASKCMQVYANASKSIQMDYDSDSDSDSDSDIINNDNNIIKEKKEKKEKIFRPPSVEEVSEYIKEKHYHFKAEAFIAFYESKGWMIGKNKMKDWKAACRTWEIKERGNISDNENELPTGLSNEQWEAFRRWSADKIPRISKQITPTLFMQMKSLVRYKSSILCMILEDINNSMYEGDIITEYTRISRTQEIRRHFNE